MRSNVHAILFQTSIALSRKSTSNRGQRSHNTQTIIGICCKSDPHEGYVVRWEQIYRLLFVTPERDGIDNGEGVAYQAGGGCEAQQR